MSNILLISLLVLGILGAVLAVVLYIVAQRFKVEENPLIDEAEACLRELSRADINIKRISKAELI